MPNTNPATGIRYGVISGNSLDDEVFADLMYGTGSRNLSEERALNELRAEARQRYDAAVEDAVAGFEDNYGGPPDNEEMVKAQAAWVEERVEKTLRKHHWPIREHQHIACDSVEDYIEWVEEHERDLQIDEPEIEGEADGVKYLISWLGGAPLVWITEGPVGYANRLCSPCVPNAADLDGGFYTREEFEAAAANRPDDMPDDLDDGYECYVPPRDWLRKEDE